MKLWFKLTAAFLLVAVVGVIVVAVLANRATAVGFSHYLSEDQAAQWESLQASLIRYYEQNGRWDGVETILHDVRPGRGMGQGGASLILVDENGQIVASAGRRGQETDLDAANISLPVVVDGRPAATLLIIEPGGQGTHAAEQFLSDVNRAIWLGGLAAVLLALILGIWLARRLTRPLRQLTQASQKVAAGKLGQQVTVTTHDEIGELAESFNQMSHELALAEQQRQQMLADVAHELRTPLSITRGHIEAILDGVFEMTPDNLALIHEETLLLGRLVEDLRTLSLAEAGQLSLNVGLVDLTDLVRQAAAGFEPLAEAEDVQLTAVVPSEPLTITADANRLRQVLGNLLSNALRHVVKGKNEPHQVTVTLENRGELARISVADNGPGLSETEQAQVFDRFWRADEARSRDRGGSGLGLAICRAIVAAHHGRIWLESIPGEGATFVVEIGELEIGD